MPTSRDAGDIGEIRPTTQGVAITVPALWAAKRKDGTFDGGIEPTEIIVDTNASESGYVVDLSSIEAQGAGPSWEAATASAAAFATLFSGTDPTRLRLNFTITGPIDGPSAGGLLACGLLAIFSGVPFKPDVTMTGTITPDGTVGLVGYIPRKLQAAAEAGYTTMIIPAEAVREPMMVNDELDLEDYADSLGVNLVPVRTVGEAFATLTGQPSFYPFAPAPALDRNTISAAEKTALNAEVQLQALIDAAPANVDPAIMQLAESSLMAAQANLASQDFIGAYGQATFGMTRLSRATGAAVMEQVLNEQGTNAARNQIMSQADDVLNIASTELARLAQSPPTGIEAQSSLPILMSWPAFAYAAAQGVREHATTADTPEILLEMARIIAAEKLSLTNTLPNAELILAASPSNPPSPRATEIFDAYEVVLNQASQANETYARVVLNISTRTDIRFSDQGRTAAIAALRELTPPTYADDFTQSAANVAIAMTDFWFTSALVAIAQAYGEDRTVTIDTRRAFATDTHDAAVSNASGTVFSIANILANQGIRADLPNWSAQWSQEVSTDYRGTPFSTEANWLAQGELWLDVLQMVMLRALATN